MFYLQTHDIEEEDPVHEEKVFQTLKSGIDNLKNGLLKREKQLSYEPKDFKRFCVEFNAEEAFLTVYDAMTSDRHSKERKELNEKRTVALLSMMALGLSQKCNTFQHDHGQLLIRSGL